MDKFLSAIPQVAGHPLALAAYAIAAVLFIVAGQSYRQLRAVMQRISDIPAEHRREVIEIVTNTRLPKTVSAEQWLRSNRQRMVFLLAGALLICATAVSTLAILHPGEPAPNLQLHDETK